MIPIPPTAEGAYPAETKYVKDELDKRGKIAKNNSFLQTLRRAASSMREVYDWLKDRNIEPGNEERTF